MPKKNPPLPKIKIETELRIQDVLALSIEKVGPKRILDIIFAQCWLNTIESCTFPANLLATKEDEEKADVAAALYFLKHTWKSSADKGMKMLKKKVEEYKKAKKE